MRCPLFVHQKPLIGGSEVELFFIFLAKSLMKFGKVLQKSIQLSKKDWETSWIDYKKLKGIVKDCVRIDQDDKLNAEAFSRQSGARDNVDMATIEQSPDEAHYFRTLRTEMRKITEFYISQQVVFVKATNKIVSEYQEMQVLE